MAADLERRRLDRHFRLVLRHLRRHTPRGSSREALHNRARHLDELERYRRRGVFPRNERYLGRRLPIFVDDHGTRCAMGHLIERSGGADVVRHVARHHNLARVHELAALPAFGAWLIDNGLTVDEAALIQPSYCEAAADCVCTSIDGPGILEGDASGGTELVLTVSAVHGNVGNIVVGDTFPLGSATQAVAGDHVLVLINQGGVSSEAWVVADGEVAVQACSLAAMLPGSLPKDVFIDATLDYANCEGILAAHDTRWTVKQGDCGMVEPGDPGDPGDPGAIESDADGGCFMAPGPHGDAPGSALLLLGAAGWILVRRRSSD